MSHWTWSCEQLDLSVIIFVLSRFFFCDTRDISFGTLKIGQNNLEIANLEFESHSFLKNHVLLPIEQAEKNLYERVYQDTNFKICLRLFACKGNILYREHIVHCSFSLMFWRQTTSTWRMAISSLLEGRRFPITESSYPPTPPLPSIFKAMVRKKHKEATEGKANIEFSPDVRQKEEGD